MNHTSEATVIQADTATEVGSGDLEVYATPAMAALMENAAMLAVANELSEDSTTVGSMLQLTHLRPTPVGEKVSATATLEEADGRRLVFSITASDTKGVIGEARHERFVVDRERFMAKLK